MSKMHFFFFLKLAFSIGSRLLTWNGPVLCPTSLNRGLKRIEWQCPHPTVIFPPTHICSPFWPKQCPLKRNIGCGTAGCLHLFPPNASAFRRANIVHFGLRSKGLRDTVPTISLLFQPDWTCGITCNFFLNNIILTHQITCTHLHEFPLHTSLGWPAIIVIGFRAHCCFRFEDGGWFRLRWGRPSHY